MSLDVAGIVAAVQSHAQSIGGIEQVLTNEPKSAPGSGITAAIWADGITPIPANSGLGAVSVLLTLMVRLMKPMLSLPYGQIDPDMLTVADSLMRAYAGAFTLGAEVQDVDLLGRYGTKMAGKAGYLTLDKALYRVIDISLPLTVPDLWSEVP